MMRSSETISRHDTLPSPGILQGMAHDPDISYFALTEGRGEPKRFGIRQADRLSHMYVLGKTGTGKTTLLETLIRQDIEAGRGFCLIDPHGDLAERVAAAVPPERHDDLLYLNAPDRAQPFGYNPLRRVSPAAIPLAASGLLEAFKKHWADAWGVRMEHLLRNALYALLEYGEATLPDILSLLRDRGFRHKVIGSITNETVRDFFEHGFEEKRYEAAIGPIENKVGALIADPLLRRILGTAPVPLSFRKIMDDRKMLVVNLARGRIGEDSMALLGSLLTTTIGLAAFSRANVPEDLRPDFFLYLDEFQTVTTGSIATMVSELRKYHVGLILANQHLTQLGDNVREAVLGNVGTTIAFRVGPQDAALLAREFGERLSAADFANLPNHHIFLRLMIDGVPSRGFSGRTLQSE